MSSERWCEGANDACILHDGHDGDHVTFHGRRVRRDRELLEKLMTAVAGHVEICTGDAYDFADMAESVGDLSETLDEVRKAMGLEPHRTIDERSPVQVRPNDG